MADGADRKPLIDPRPCGATVDERGRPSKHGSRRCGGAIKLPESRCSSCGAKLLRPQPGPQSAFLACRADMALYGGAAGGGKSWSLLVDALSHAINTPGWVGIIFRARHTDLVGDDGIWAEARKVFAGTNRGGGDPHFREGEMMDVRWDGGGTLLFRHLDKKNVRHYAGKAYAWIGFDEANEIAIEHIIFLRSRLRSLCGSRPVVRMTCNPDPDHDLARWVEPYLHLDESKPEYGTADRSKSGTIRYFARSKKTNKIEFGESREAVAELTGRLPSRVKTFAFIPSLLSDNRILEHVNPEYRANIEDQDAVKEAQLGDGNWKIKPNTNGILSRDRWGGILTEPLAPIVRRVRAWDTGATKPKNASDDEPDFTGGVLMLWDIHDRFYLAHLAPCRLDTPQRDRYMREIAEADGQHVKQVIPQDPGAGGKDAVHYQRANMHGVPNCGPVVDRRAHGAKLVRANPLANALEKGLKINGKREPAGYILDADEQTAKRLGIPARWMSDPYDDGGRSPPTVGALLWSHLNPFGSGEEKHDDFADAAADAYAVGAAPPSRRVDPRKRARMIV
jgi:hypothetical protein